MSKKSFDVIDSALGIMPQLEHSNSVGELVVVESEIVVNVEQDREDDYNFVRNKMREVIEKATDGFEDILELANDAESPRAYEVAANFANTIASVSKNLMELHKETAKQVQPEQPKNVTNNTQNIFTGTTAELLTLLKQQQLTNGSSQT
jgi:gas vesicle protein